MVFLDKKSTRAYFLEKRAAQTTEERKRSSEQLCRHIISLNEFKDADTVLLFYPSRNEPDLLKVMDAAISLDKKAAFPISFTNDLSLGFREILSLSDMTLGTYNIPEPPNSAPIPIITKKTLCIVPALALDKRGFRIGYGKGYYDRFLSSFEGISLCAVSEGFVCNALPTEKTDIPIDILITETGVIRHK